MQYLLQRSITCRCATEPVADCARPSDAHSRNLLQGSAARLRQAAARLQQTAARLQQSAARLQQTAARLQAAAARATQRSSICNSAACATNGSATFSVAQPLQPDATPCRPLQRTTARCNLLQRLQRSAAANGRSAACATNGSRTCCCSATHPVATQRYLLQQGTALCNRPQSAATGCSDCSAAQPPMVAAQRAQSVAACTICCSA